MSGPRQRTWADRLQACVVDPAARARTAAVTGLLLTLFAVAHCAMALTLLAGPDGFESLVDALHTQPAFRAVEVVLAAAFAVHLVLGFGVVATERRAAPEARRLRAPRLLTATATLLAVFLVWHATQFRFGVHPDAYGEWDFAGAVTAALREPPIALAYLGAAGALALHVGVGLRASLDGLWPPRRPARWRTAVSWATGLALAAGYGCVPLWVWLGPV